MYPSNNLHLDFICIETVVTKNNLLIAEYSNAVRNLQKETPSKS